jgi:6-phosphogluconolactonase (cycloisomerase 2 family)
MTRTIRWARATGLALLLFLVPIAAARPAAAGQDRYSAGHVYTQTNAAEGNAVVSFERAADGHLTPDETVATGGLGTSAGLGDQASLAITSDRAHLLVVNAGSDDVSLFEADDDGLELADVQPVGDRPVSVAVHGNLVYVLNQGADTIQALRISDEDTLVDVPQSTRPLSTTNADAAQVAFSPDGRLLAVTEKDTQTIDTYVVRANGRAVGPNAQPSSGATPFGFQFGPDGRLYVSEAPGSAASSYDVDRAGTISALSASVPNHQAAACWLVVTEDGRFAYTANAGSATVSQYAIAQDGTLSLVGDGAAGATDPGPVDLDVSDGDGFLYVLNSRSGSISGFSIDPDDGSLTPLAGVSGFATGWAGLVAV